MSWMYNAAFVFFHLFLLFISSSLYTWLILFKLAMNPLDIQRVPKIPGCVPPIWGVSSVHLYCTSGWKVQPFSFFHKDASYTWHSVTLGKEARNHISHTWHHQQAGCMAQALVPKLYPPTTNLCLSSPLDCREYPFSTLLHQCPFAYANLGQFWAFLTIFNDLMLTVSS